MAAGVTHFRQSVILGQNCNLVFVIVRSVDALKSSIQSCKRIFCFIAVGLQQVYDFFRGFVFLTGNFRMVRQVVVESGKLCQVCVNGSKNFVF